MIHIRPLTLALLGSLAVSPTAFAQQADTAAGKHFAVVGGYAVGEPTRNPELGDSRMQLDGDGVATLSASWFVNDNVAVEAWGAVDKMGQRVNLDGRKAGSVEAQPYALSGQYHFGEADQTVRPFVGLGYYQTNYDGETTLGSGELAGQRLAVESPHGAMATAGVDFNINPTWFARADVRYLQGDSDVELDGATVGEAEFDPVFLGVGLGARF